MDPAPAQQMTSSALDTATLRTPARASRALSIWGIVVAWLGPLLIVVLALIGVGLNRLAYLFGMPDADALVVPTIAQYAGYGAVVGIVFALIALGLTILATTRKVRANVVLVVAWVSVGVSAFFCVACTALPALLAT